MTVTSKQPISPDAPPASGLPGAAGPRRIGRPLQPYTRFARSMRIVLPLVAVMITMLVIAWPQLGEQPNQFSLGISQMAANDSGGQQVVNARFTGTDRQQRPYTVTADTAEQVQMSPDLVDLSFPKADLTLRDGAWLALSADSGLYDRKGGALDLRGTVSLFHDDGHELHTSVARIDLVRGTASGDEPVAGQGPIGRVRSTGFQILDDGKRLIFSGRSRLILYPTAPSGEGRG